MAAEVPALLRKLQAAGVPGERMLTVPRSQTKSGVSRWGKVERAAWSLGTHPYKINGDPVTGEMYLLSDGRIRYLDWAQPPKRLRQHLGVALAGVRRLAARYP